MTVIDLAERRITDPTELVQLFADPAGAAARACDARARGSDRRIHVRSTPGHPMPAVAGVIRGDTFHHLSSETARWPDPRTLEPGDRLVLRVEHDQLAAYCAWLIRAATVAIDWTLTPFCPQPGGLFRLHLIAAARLALPARVRVEVRHDLHGVRLAQVALGFGADTLAGPIDAGRHLPLAGVPRPSETSAAALCELVRQAGLEPTTTASEIRP